MKWSGLIRKLLLGIVLIEVMMLSILVYNSVRLLNSTHAELFERTINEEAALLSSLLVSGLSVLDRALVNENLQLFSKQANVKYAVVYDRRNRVMAKVGVVPANFKVDESFEQAEIDGLYDTEFKIQLDDQVFGVLRAGFSVEEIATLSSKAKLQNTIIAITEIILSVLATVLIGLYLIKRISLLQKGARELQDGNYDYQMPVTSNDEIGELAIAYNKLGTSLASSKKELLEKQDEILQKATRFSRLLNSVNAVIYEASTNPFSINFVNKEAENLLGYPLSDWQYPSFLQTITHVDDVVTLKQFIQFPENEEFHSFDYRVCKNNGEILWLRQITNIEKNSGQDSINVILFDITKEKQNVDMERARDIALAENRTKNLFLANMSHELRTPLNAIIGYSELIYEENEGTAELDREMVAEDLGKITRSARHLLALINEVLDISKINAGKFDLNITEFNVQQLIKDVTDMVAPLAEKNNNQLTVKLNDDFTIHADQQRLHQVVVNICANACKFTENGAIELSVERDADASYYFIIVKDTGIGIKPEELNLVFQEFSRTEDVDKIEGTGLGLCLSQKLCKIMGGEILVSSEYKIGSTFTVSMPLLVRTHNR